MTGNAFRTPAGGRIDRSRPLRFTFNGQEYTGYAGDTLASALLANGVHQVTSSIKFGRPRGIVTAGADEPSAVVQIEAPFPEPMLTAPTVEIHDGLVACGLPGQGRLAAEPDPARYDAVHAHCEVLIVGAGPAGLAAALTAARGGVRVIIVDEQPEPGGALLGTTDQLDGRPAAGWAFAVATDGMVIDDGTVIRVDDDRFLLTTTTGNAAAILDWMEEWLQTEWPHLRVSLTSVTEHWVTVPLVGPRSRDVLARVAPDLDVSNDAFGFMTWRDAVVAGIESRVCRISFSGELAYEINVSAWYGLALWEALIEAGRPDGITPYGTETMHVLRAEKGYPVIGQDTDGTVTPHDLGLSWAVSKKKPDFIGKRSFARAQNQRPDRKHLVGLLPADGTTVLAEGAQILAPGKVPEPPVPMLGHVTSSYRSAALGRPFALALVRAGRDRIGETLQAWHDGEVVPVTVTDPVLYDKEGARDRLLRCRRHHPAPPQAPAVPLQRDAVPRLRPHG